MPPGFKNWRIWVILAVVILVALTAVESFVGDPQDQKRAEAFCITDVQVREMAGAISTIHLDRWRLISATRGEGARREYQFNVTGSKLKNLLVVVRSEVVQKGEAPKYSVISIRSSATSN